MTRGSRFGLVGPACSVFEVGAEEHQTVGAALAFGVGDAGLGAADLSLQHPLFLLLQFHDVFPALRQLRFHGGLLLLECFQLRFQVRYWCPL